MRLRAPIDAAGRAEAERRRRFGVPRIPGSDPPQLAWQHDRLTPAVVVAFIVGYGVVAALSGELSNAQGLSPWFPPVGLSLALVLVYGLRAAPVVFAADAIQLLVRGEGGSVVDVLLQAAAQAFFWGATGALLRPRLLAVPALSRVRDVAWFALVVVGGALVAAVAGVALIFALDGSDWSGYRDAVREYFAGDALGLLTITPAALVLAGIPRRRVQAREAVQEAARHPLEFAGMWIATLFVPALAIGMWNGDLLPLAPLPVAWVALRLGMPAASIGLLVWSMAAVTAYSIGGSDVSLREISTAMVAGGLLAIFAGAVVTERERGRARLAYLALHDELTGLPNERGFTETVADALGRSQQPDVAVLLVRLSELPGHEAADTLDPVLIEAANRLRRLTGPDSTIARIGWRRFVLLVDGPDARRLDVLADRLIAGLSEPVFAGDREYLLGPVIGTARGHGGLDPRAVLQRATRAVDAAETDASRTADFDAEMDQRTRSARELGDDLQRAIADGALTLAFQPIVSMATGAPIAAEALLRWSHPVRGPVGPNEFIPVAESCGLILPIGRWVLREACRTAAAWPPSSTPLVVHVNVSPVQLHDDGLVDQVRSALDESGLDPLRLCLELTESALFDDLDVAASRIRELGALGVSVVLDDFGTGHSSLSWLQRLPVTALKVDRSFVSGMESRPVDVAIVSATLRLAQALGLETVAEGVETDDQLAMLRDLGCTSVQGYLLCRPVPDPEFRAWMTGRTAAA